MEKVMSTIFSLWEKLASDADDLPASKESKPSRECRFREQQNHITGTRSYPVRVPLLAKRGEHRNPAPKTAGSWRTLRRPVANTSLWRTHIKKMLFIKMILPYYLTNTPGCIQHRFFKIKQWGHLMIWHTFRISTYFRHANTTQLGPVTPYHRARYLGYDRENK